MVHAELTLTHGPRTALGDNITPAPSVSSKKAALWGLNRHCETVL